MKKAQVLTASLLALAVAGCGGGGQSPEAATPSETAAQATEWSLEAADFLFVSNRDGDPDIYLLSGGATDWINLTDNTAVDNWPEWSPDGSRIVFQSDRSGNLDIWVMNADGSNPVQLTDDLDHDYLPAWSPDGTEITFVSWRTEPGDEERANHIYIMSADGAGQRRLVSDSPGTSAAASWSADGRNLVSARKYGEQGADIVLLDREGTLVRRLTDDNVSNGAPVFSPDGGAVAFYADHGKRSELVIVNIDGTVRRSVPASEKCWYPRWSPDGRWLLYTAAVPGSSEDDLDILAVPLDREAAPVTLVGGPSREAEARWRPQR